MLYIYSEENRKKAIKQKILFYWIHNLVQGKIIQMIKKIKGSVWCSTLVCAFCCFDVGLMMQNNQRGTRDIMKEKLKKIRHQVGEEISDRMSICY